MRVCSAWMLWALLSPGLVFAWGPHGHQVVAEIGARHLGDKARAEVELLLGDRAEQAMREASTWADEAREQPEFKHTFRWHFVNFERGVCAYQVKQQCAQQDCVIGAIQTQSKRLGNRKLSATERAEALRFVIHFVGDIHQPLHAGWRDDRGGNDTQVRLGRDGLNMHGLWDDRLAKRGKLRVREHADWIEQQSRTDAKLIWQSSAPVDWAMESCALIKTEGFYPKGVKLPENYLSTYRPVAEQRMLEGGLRLAALLNQVLGQ